MRGKELAMYWKELKLGHGIGILKKNEITINERWANIVGYKADELGVITYRQWMESLHHDDVIRISLTLGKVFSREIDYYDVEYRQKHKKGNYVCGSCSWRYYGVDWIRKAIKNVWHSFRYNKKKRS